MSKRLIYEEDAIDALMEILDRPNHAEFLYTDEICKALKELPSAQPVRKTGQWIKRKKGAIGYNCSCCGKSDISNHFDYCPNCGADMRGDEDE